MFFYIFVVVNINIVVNENVYIVLKQTNQKTNKLKLN